MELRKLRVDDITQDYVDWLNNPEINKYLECRFQTHTIESVKEWLLTSDHVVWGVFVPEHVGNITWYAMNEKHKCLRVGACIGKRKKAGEKGGLTSWGLKGLIEGCRLAFEEGYHRIEACIYDGNKTSMKLVEATGFYQESILKERVIYNGEYMDLRLYVMFKENLRKFKRRK